MKESLGVVVLYHEEGAELAPGMTVQNTP